MSESQSRPSRRGFMVGAAVVGAATAAVVALPKRPADAQAPTGPQPPKPERGGGYHVTEHIRQYYKTTLV